MSCIKIGRLLLGRLLGIIVVLGGNFIKLIFFVVFLFVIFIGVLFLFDVDLLLGSFFIFFLLFVWEVCCCCCGCLGSWYCFFKVCSVFMMFWKLFEILLSCVRRLVFSIVVFEMFVILIFVIILFFCGEWEIFCWGFCFCFIGNVVFCLSKMLLYLERCCFWFVFSLI